MAIESLRVKISMKFELQNLRLQGKERAIKRRKKGDILYPNAFFSNFLPFNDLKLVAITISAVNFSSLWLP